MRFENAHSPLRPIVHDLDLVPAYTVSLPLSCQLVEGVIAFASTESAWRTLQESVPSQSGAVSWESIMCWWHCFGEVCPKTNMKGVPYMVRVSYEGHEVALFPFVLQSDKARPFAVRRLRPMGYSGELEPFGLLEEPMALILPGFEDHALNAVSEFLTTDSRHLPWDCFIVRALAEHRPATAGPRGHRCVVTRKVKTGPQMVHLPSSWQAFRKQLSKSMRDNLPYYPRLLTRDGHSWSVKIHRADEGLDALLDKLIALHKDRVASEISNGHDDYFQLEAQRQMLLECHRRLPLENAFIATLEADGEIIAAQSFWRSGSTVSVMYSGFAPGWAKYSPLLVLQSEIFKNAIEEGVEKLNLLYGTAPWQMRWQPATESFEVRLLGNRIHLMSCVRCGIYAVQRELSLMRRRQKNREVMARIRPQK